MQSFKVLLQFGIWVRCFILINSFDFYIFFFKLNTFWVLGKTNMSPRTISGPGDYCARIFKQ